MLYRELGKTGENVSVIGLGCEHLDGKPYEQVNETIGAALDAGVNILDVFMPGRQVRENIAKALGKRRSDVLIQGHIGSTDIRQQYDISRDLPTVQRYFEDLLRIFGYIDFGMMFFIDSETDYKNVFETDFADYVQRLKKQGDIRHIGFSAHNPVTAAKVIETGLPDMMLFSLNPAFDMLPVETDALGLLDDDAGMEQSLRGELRGIDPKRTALYQLCTRKQVGITVMKTFGGGKLLSPEHSPFVRPLTVPQCIHYALSRPAVASALVGCQTADEVRQAMAYLTATEAEKDYSETINSIQNDFQGHCVYCNHCQPCPAAIDIAAVNKYLDIAGLDKANIPPSVKSHYHSLAHSGGECIQCGSCEERCPFGVKIIENMAEAEALLG